MRVFAALSAVAVIAGAVVMGAGNATAAPGSWTQTDVNNATTAGVNYIDSQCALNPDGHCGSSFPFSETGMALVAYSVEQGGVGGFANMPPAHQAHVKAAIHYLLVNQAVDGSWADFGFYQTYSTGIDLGGLSAFTTVDPGVPAAIASARNFLINLDWQGPPREVCSSAQFGAGNDYCGGWNYDPGLLRSDESNTGFAMFGLFLTGGIPASIAAVNIGWQNNIQELTATNPQYSVRNDGGGDYLPGVAGPPFFFPPFSSNANDSGSMLFGYAYDSVPSADPRVQAGLKFGQDVLDTYEKSLPATRTGIYHDGANEDGSCVVGAALCDWHDTGDGGYHYGLFALTKGLGEYIPPVLSDPNNWYAKVVDLLITQQNVNGSWPDDGRDDGSQLMATAFAVSALGLVAVEQPISNATGLPFSATEGQNACGNVATFNDADNKAVAGDYSATIDWGDGSSSPGTVSGSNGRFTVSGCHTYSEEGKYTIKVTITDVDNSGNTATTSSTATVADAALTSSCTMPPVITTTFVGSTAEFTDGSSTGTLSDFSATISWGDTTSSMGTIVGGPGLLPYDVSGSHNYSTTGTFTVTTTIKDVGGSQTVATCHVFVAGFPTANGGTFVIGDLEAGLGNHVTWWSSQWAKINQMSGGPAPSSMKGFAGFEDMPLPSPIPPLTKLCGMTWTTDTGNSSPP
ncbi:MAG: hypothetical protein E6I89_04150, partial [Chloroflexi bacterium]